MALIPQFLSQIVFIGPDLDLGLPEFQGKFKVIYKLKDNGLGFISYKPGLAFSGFTQLVAAPAGLRPQVYILDVLEAFLLDDKYLANNPIPVGEVYPLADEFTPIPTILSLPDE